MNILVTGGAGYIGSHTIVELIEAGHTPIIVDNFSNSSKDAVERLEGLVKQKLVFYKLDVRDTKQIRKLLNEHKVEAVIHFAAFMSVPESVDQPLEYYQNNVSGLLSLLDAMQQAKVTNILFSSSCTVYGNPDELPIREGSPIKPAVSPYGQTKQMCEQILTDTAAASDLSACILRYFNPIGAHPSGKIGESLDTKPNCLLPYVTAAASGLKGPLTIHGDDYDTPDGSPVRDYLHVVDLARAHVRAIEYVKYQTSNVSIFNIGRGVGSSVFEIVKTFEKINKIEVPYTVGPRRKGDAVEIYASAEKAEKVLGWKAELSLEDALRDAWRWQKQLMKDQKPS